jgi:hypothetical protein
MAIKVSTLVPGDWLRGEAKDLYSREKKTVLSGQTVKCGEVCALNAAGKAISIVATGDETHTYTFTGTPTAGTFTVSMWDYRGFWCTTTAIAYDETQANVIKALNQALVGADSGAVTSVVTGGGTAITAFTVVFSGTNYTATQFPLGQADYTLLTSVTACAVTRSTAAGVGRDEVQTITLSAAMTAGDYRATIYMPDNVPLNIDVAWNTNWATTMADINTAITAAATAWYGGASAGAVMTGTATAQILTFSGNGCTLLAIPLLAEVDVGGCTGPTSASIARTTSGGVAGNRVGMMGTVVAMEAVDASAADADGVFIARDAIVDADSIIYGGGDVAGVALALASVGILVESEGTRKILPSATS